MSFNDQIDQALKDLQNYVNDTENSIKGKNPFDCHGKQGRGRGVDSKLLQGVMELLSLKGLQTPEMFRYFAKLADEALDSSTDVFLCITSNMGLLIGGSIDLFDDMMEFFCKFWEEIEVGENEDDSPLYAMDFAFLSSLFFVSRTNNVLRDELRRLVRRKHTEYNISISIEAMNRMKKSPETRSMLNLIQFDVPIKKTKFPGRYSAEGIQKADHLTRGHIEYMFDFYATHYDENCFKDGYYDETESHPLSGGGSSSQLSRREKWKWIHANSLYRDLPHSFAAKFYPKSKFIDLT